MIRIMVRAPDGTVYRLDTANNDESAQHLIDHYRKTYSTDWHVYQDEEQDEKLGSDLPLHQG